MQPANRITPQHRPAQPDDGPYARLEAELADLPFGKRIAFLRNRLELSQRVTAELAGRSAVWLSQVERGVRGCDNLMVIADLAIALQVPPALLIDMDLRSILNGDGGQRSARPGVATPSVGRAQGIRDTLAALETRLDSLERRFESQQLNGIADDQDTVTVWVIAMTGEVPTMNPVRLSRRQVLAAGGAALLASQVGLLDPDERARIAAAVDAPGRADMAIVAHLETLLAHCRGLDHALGGSRLLAPMQASLELVNHLQKTARPPAQRALLSVAAQYEQHTGWLWTDRGDHAMANRLYDQALARATESGEHALARYVLACKSEQTRYTGDAATAVDLAQAAQYGEVRLTPAVRARAADWEARALALDGKADECMRKLDEAAELLAQSTANSRLDEPPWIHWFVEEQLAVHLGICLTDLGEAGPAIEVFDRTIAALPADRVRDRAYYLSCSAQAHVGGDDPDQAGVVACEAARLAIPIGHTRSLAKLHGLYTELVAAGREVPAVRDLGELLRIS